MALNPMYFVTGDLSTYFVNKNTGLPLANGSISFYRDVARNTPKTVYQLTGAPPNYTYVPLPNPVQLSAVGTPQDNLGNNVIIYYYPYDASGNLDLYYAVVADSNNVMNATIEAWPNITAGDNPTQNDFSISNQIANCQFTQTFLNSNAPTVYTVTSASNQVFSFAPDWDFVISGTGSVTIQQVAIAGNDHIVTSPPYVLDITTSSGITACYLRQRFSKNSGLWSSTTNNAIFLSGSFIAINQLGGSTGIELFYVESTGGSAISIVQGNVTNSGYSFITGVTANAIPVSTNTDTGTSGYIDIYLSFLPNSRVRISSIQVVPTLNQAGANIIPFELNSSNREQAFMGDYYIPRLNERPNDSILQGWDFTVNPFQFAASGNITTTAAYICDQTIACAGSSGNVAFSQDAVTDGLHFNTAASNGAFYIMQYLSGADAKKILGTPLSVNAFGYVTSTSNNVTMQIYLFRAPSTSSIPILPTSIGTVNNTGLFTLTAAGWTQIPRSGLNTAASILPSITSSSDINNSVNDMGFTGWQLTDTTQMSDTNYFAMVVTFAYIDTSTQITINSISLIPNEIPARPSPKSSTEVLKECQYYYEKSYNKGIYAPSNSVQGAIIVEQAFNTALSLINANSRFIPIRYEVTKRLSINPTFYSVSGNSGNVTFSIYGQTALAISANIAISGNWTFVNVGENGMALQPIDRGATLLSTTQTSQFNEVIASFHFVSDARLGIV